MVVAIILTFTLISTASAVLSIWATSRSKHRASVVEVAARQRTLAERYIQELLLVRSGQTADPVLTGQILATSARALLDGGTAPAVNGDDDATQLAAATDPVVRAQLNEQMGLVRDLTATGNAFLAHRPVSSVRLTAHEKIQSQSPVQRLRVLAALTSNVSLDAARTIAAKSGSEHQRSDPDPGRTGGDRPRRFASARLGARRNDAAADRALPESRHVVHRSRARS